MFEMGVAKEIVEPPAWKYDDGPTRRVPVVDPNDGRVIRHVGWRKCLSCDKNHFTRDVIRLRICESCKTYKTD
jgi:hypothetical protein